jgi:hypothetical protein
MTPDDHSGGLTIRRLHDDVINFLNTNSYGSPLFAFHEDFKFTAKSAEIDKEESWQENYDNT